MARADYSKEQRDAWQAARLAGERARGQHSSKINQLPRYDSKTMNIFAPRPNSQPAQITPRKDWSPKQEAIYKKIQADIATRRAGKPTTSKVTTPADIAKEKMLQAAKAAPKHAVLHWDGGNSATCFDSGTYNKKTGVLNLVFQKRDDGGGFDFDVDLETAIDIFMADSPGAVFNSELR